MTRKAIYRLAGAAAILVVLLGALPLLTYPWVFSNQEAIDVNSGDTMHRIYICGLPIRESTQTTAFSREVRRLGIDVRGVRDWKRVDAGVLIGRPISYRYSGVPDVCDFLVRLLDTTETPDEDRSHILKEALTALQSGEISHLDTLLKAAGSKLG